MINLSDFDFKNHLTVFQVLIDGVVIAYVPLGFLETHYLSVFKILYSQASGINFLFM